MKPFLEKMPVEEGSSICRLNRRLDVGIPFQWHHHPEYELTLTTNSRGQRFIGDHVGEYDDGDLVLVGPNLPHTWSSRSAYDEGEPHVALVIWFHPEWAQQLTRNFHEFAFVGNLLRRATRGLSFSPDVASAVRQNFSGLFELPPPGRLLLLLQILGELDKDTAAQPLASSAFNPINTTENKQRIERVLTHIHQCYRDPISLEILAQTAALSVSGLHRLFRKHTHTNVSTYLSQLRIGDACAQLSKNDRPISSIARDVGFSSLANFNRQFRAAKAMTPRAYRALFRSNVL